MKRILYTFLIVLGVGFTAKAQFNLGMHQFIGVPQSNYTNPALLPQARFFIALPSIYVNYYNPTFVADDIIKTVGDSSMLDFSKLYNERAGGTFGFNIEQQAELFHLGFRIKKKNFISLGVYSSLQTSMRLPVDLLRLVQEGTTSPYFQSNPIELSGLDFGVQAYVAYHIGFARQFNEKFSLGVRFKYINGLLGGGMDYSNGQLVWNIDSIRLNGGFRYNAAGLGKLDEAFGFLGGEGSGAGTFNVSEWVPTTGNFGYGFDIGATYKPFKRLLISASATDLGSINWTQNVTSWESNSFDYNYKGGQIGGNEGGAGPFEGIQDSLLAAFNVQRTAGTAFSTPLNTRYILSASLELLPNMFVGGMYSQNMYSGTNYPAITGFAQFKIWNLLFLRGNYTIAQGTFDNLGGALAVKVGPAQIYTVADNLMALSNQGNVSSFNFRIGANILLGMRKPREKKEDKVDPLVD